MTEIENQGHSPHPLETWGGIECTVNRVGEHFYDQLVWNGHHSRPEDLARFADLGIQAIRYPVLWERSAPDGLQNASWQWSDERLNILRSLNIRPIVGLVHHGSGPRYTSLRSILPSRKNWHNTRVRSRSAIPGLLNTLLSMSP